MTVAEATAYARKKLSQNGAEGEARLVMQTALGCSFEALLTRRREELTGEEQERLAQVIAQRLSGRPLQYIMGEWDFMGLSFAVREGVLIPRADTETLCETALKLAAARGYASCLDLCTGSGCLAVAIAALGNLAVTASDISPAALRIAAQNAERNNVSRLVSIFGSDMFEQIDGKFDMIVSNPPYIPTTDIPTLMREVREHEPIAALDGGEDGLDFYRIIAREGPSHLEKGGALLVEVGAGQAGDVAELFSAAGLRCIEITRDLSGIERVVKAELAV